MAIKLMFPVFAHKIDISSNFGMRVHPATGKKQLHEGIDIRPLVRGVDGDRILSPADGEVVKAAWNNAAGNYMTVWHPVQKIYTNYQHLMSFAKKQGDKVKRGDVIAYMGNTGSSTTGTHLHFAIGTSATGAKFIPKTSAAIDPMGGKFEWVLQKDWSEPVVKSAVALYRVKIVSSPILNVRMNAGTNYAKVGTVKFGEEHPIYEEKVASNGKKWGRIGASRWISIQPEYSVKIGTTPAVKPPATPVAKKEFTIKVTTASLKIRKTGSIMGTFTGKYVYKNDRLVIVDTNGSWGKLKDGRGWIGIGSKYVQRV